MHMILLSLDFDVEVFFRILTNGLLENIKSMINDFNLLIVPGLID